MTIIEPVYKNKDGDVISLREHYGVTASYNRYYLTFTSNKSEIK